MTQPEPIEVDDPSTAVAVAFVHNGDEVDYSFFHSYVQLIHFDAANEGRTWRGGEFSIRAGTDGLAAARNTAVQGFLSESKADWFCWFDTDMGFAPETVDLLLQAADPAERPVMGGLCFANREVENDGMGGRIALAAPVIMDWKTVDGEQGFDTRWNYAQNAIVRCDGVGSACVLIHRSVFERVLAEFGPNWYSRARNPSTNQLISEDLSFCVRANALDIPIHVHTGVKTTHAKRVWLSETHYWQQRLLNSAPSTAEGAPIPVAAPTWTVPRYAVIPTHNRPARLLALVVSLGAQCDHIVIVDNASTPPVDQAHLQASVPEHCRVEVIRDEEQPPNLSRIWNVMFDHCAEAELVEDETACGDEDHCAQFKPGPAWDVAVFNDDSVVPAGWYNTVATALREHDSAVVAHTAPTSPLLLTELHNDHRNRMAPHAFIMRGEVDLRSDESMQWWYFDTDLDLRARKVGGVLSVPGPQVINAQANSTTRGALAVQAEKDRIAFEAKWAGQL
jgi:GT2 family glycosyltransferase